MDSMQAFMRGEANRGKELKVFDWDKAAQIIKEKGALYASAGLSGDWEWTGGEILREGKPVNKDDTYCYLASTWATPQLDVCGEIIACYKMQGETDDWGSDTYWPESSLSLLEDKQ